MTAKEAARELGCCYRTVLNLIDSGDISGKKQGSKQFDAWDIDPESVREFKHQIKNSISIRAAAEFIGCSYQAALDFAKSGRLPAKRRGKGSFFVSKQEFTAFKSRNERLVKTLKERYVRLFYSGISKESLQEQVPLDFANKGILFPARGFVEVAIYEDMMKKKKGENESGTD